ncbi:CPBP family intramembrane metalloprotease [Haloferax mediterranei ATCC 33500]|uniref:CPBP family intramembrane metalloprotease n=2 Tax=Haloferacaceae TaxID=1644056 RepID=I3R4E1_HALMT|nr:CPBP family intramembrane glutamic endopeptidase [Haloferax mediterranei]AFK19101.1 hem operon protein [Haloferax mediterranei ATCC 33500]AHZ21538.1 hem operon protein [Haloferax mediterranei ATCC 33500]EMA03999.1 hem operon protein [Haloferax mediterranei ATCC 33500]MDX5989196.1 CPBP family intramembrane glutamic endopeptidase [Haloferax mediterranei ATCC 33500]QCQ75574.1 CPBP family intramembrane metalloprotease [Haloferax mediterranei ATCC 33500]
MTETASESRQSLAEFLGANVPTLFGLFVALAGPMLVGEFLLFPLTAEFSGLAEIPFWVGHLWLTLGVLVALVLYWERESLASIGVARPTLADIGVGVVGFVVGVMVFMLSQPLLSAVGLYDANSGQALLSQPLPVVLASAITAGIVEEVLFRGYPIERLLELTGNVWLAAGIPLAVFTAIHIPLWGVGTTLQIGAWSVVVTGVYLWRRTLVAPIVMHLLNDIVGFVILPALG